MNKVKDRKNHSYSHNKEPGDLNVENVLAQVKRQLKLTSKYCSV